MFRRDPLGFQFSLFGPESVGALWEEFRTGESSGPIAKMNFKFTYYAVVYSARDK